MFTSASIILFKIKSISYVLTLLFTIMLQNVLKASTVILTHLIATAVSLVPCHVHCDQLEYNDLQMTGQLMNAFHGIVDCM